MSLLSTLTVVLFFLRDERKGVDENKCNKIVDKCTREFLSSFYHFVTVICFHFFFLAQCQYLISHPSLGCTQTITFVTFFDFTVFQMVYHFRYTFSSMAQSFILYFSNPRTTFPSA